MGKGKSPKISKIRKRAMKDAVSENQLLDSETRADMIAEALEREHFCWLDHEQLRSLAEILRCCANFNEELAWRMFTISESNFV